MRIACIHIPQFALQSATRIDPALRGAPVAVVSGSEPGRELANEYPEVPSYAAEAGRADREQGYFLRVGGHLANREASHGFAAVK